MIFLIILWTLFLLTGLNWLYTMIRFSAGYLRIALFGFVDRRGVVIHFDRARRLNNLAAGIVLPGVTAALVTVGVYYVALLLAQLR